MFINHRLSFCVLHLLIYQTVGDIPQLSVFHPVLCFRYTHVETWSSLMHFDGHMLFSQFPTLHPPPCRPGGRAQADMPSFGLPWQVFLEVELLNHRVCLLAASLTRANLLSEELVGIYSSNTWEFRFLHILTSAWCCWTLQFLPIWLGVEWRLICISLWLRVSWTLLQVCWIFRSPMH